MDRSRHVEGKLENPDGRRHRALLLGHTRCLRGGNRKRVEGIACGSVWLELDLDHVLGAERRSLFCIANLYPGKHLSSNGKTHRNGRDLRKLSNSSQAVNGLECHTQ